MKCRKVSQLIPLYAGADLSAKTTALVQDHLRDCRRCQQDYMDYLNILQQTQDWMAQERVDWQEAEWQKTVQNAVNKAEVKQRWLVPWPFKREWAFVLMFASAILLSLLVLHPEFVKDKVGGVSTVSAVESQPEIVSLKIVSKETGLKINWFFHKDLKLEVMK